MAIAGCASSSENPVATSTFLTSTQVTETVLPSLTSTTGPTFELRILNPPSAEKGLPDLVVGNDGTLYLTTEKDIVPNRSRPILSNTKSCLVDRVTASYSPDYQFIALAQQCAFSESSQSVYLVHSDGIGLIRTIVGYDSYESGTNRDIEWAPDSKSLVYYRTPGYSDAHIEVFAGLFRYDIETAERKFLAQAWGEYRWSLDGKWIAILETNAHDGCQKLYLLDAQGEGLWEVDNICDLSSIGIEIFWQEITPSNPVLVVLQRESENQNIVFRKEYDVAKLSFNKPVPIR
jgi:hypothetical protein